MKIFFTQADVVTALAKYARISVGEIELSKDLPEFIASSEKVAPPAKTGRMRGSKNKTEKPQQENIAG